MHGLLMHRRHLRLVLHVVHRVHEVLLVHAVLHHMLLRVHVVRHLLRLFQRRTARHAACCRRRRLQLARRVNRRRWRLVPVRRPVPITLRTHMTHLRRTVRPVAVLFHLLIVPQPVVRRKPRVRHPGRGLRRVVVLRRPELLIAAVHLVPLLRHRAVMRVSLLVLMAPVPHVRHVRVGEVGHVIAAVGAHRGPAARAARVRIFRCRFSALRPTLYHSLLTTRTLLIPFTARRFAGVPLNHWPFTVRRTVSPHLILGESLNFIPVKVKKCSKYPV